MSLSLDEINSLVGALGIKVPEEILTRKVKAQEFAVRRGKIAGEGSGKPDDWRLKAEFEDVIKRAGQSAGKQEFSAALALLDEGERLLQQPDVAPAPPAPPVSEPVAAEVVSRVPEPESDLSRRGTAQREGEDALTPGAGVFAIWRDAKERVDAQVSQLQGARCVPRAKRRCARCGGIGRRF